MSSTSDEEQPRLRRSGSLVSVAIRKVLEVEEGQSFIQTLRRAFAYSNAAISLFAFAYGIYWVWMGAIGDAGSGGGTMFQGIVAFLMGISLIVHAVVTTLWGKVSDAHQNALMWTLLPPCAFMTVTIPEFGTRPLLIWYLFQCVIAQAPHAPAQGIFAMVFQIISCYNDAYETTGTQLVLLPGARQGGPPLEQLGQLIGSTLIVNGIAVAMYLQQVEYKDTYEEARQADAARCAVSMSMEVVELLRKYDTDGVRRVLDRYESSEVDPALLKSFKAMKHNLDMYRPHLPNYVFIQEDFSPAIGGDDGNGGGGGKAYHIAGEMEVQSFGETTNEGDISDTEQSPSNSSLELSIKKPASLYVKGSTASNLGGERDQSSDGSGAKDSTLGNSRRLSLVLGTPMHAQPVTMSKKITVALVDCRSVTNFRPAAAAGAAVAPGTSPSPMTNAQKELDGNIQRFVDSVYTIAQVTQASVHSMIGDVVQVTWNATNRIAQHEIKAARFLSLLQSEAELLTGSHLDGSTPRSNSTPRLSATGLPNLQTAFGAGLALSGTACTGMAKVHVITSSTRQQALLINSGWGGLLRGCFRVARRHRTMTIDATTHSQAYLEIDSRGVDVVSYENTGDGTSSDKSYSLMITDAEFEQQQPSSSSSKSLARQNSTLMRASSMLKDPGTGFDDYTNPKSRSIVYEVAGEFRHKDQEWMYQVQKATNSNSNPNLIITAALENAMKGHFGEALTQLFELEDSVKHLSPLRTSAGHIASTNSTPAKQRTSLIQPPGMNVSPGTPAAGGFDNSPRKASDTVSLAAQRSVQAVVQSTLVRQLMEFCEKSLQKSQNQSPAKRF